MVISNKGFTLLELLVAALILALVVAGLGSIFLAGKWYIIHSRSLTVAAQLTRYFLDPLQANVSQDTWNTSCLGLQNCPEQTLQDNQSIPGNYSYNYTANYSISNISVNNLTKVKVTIRWNELAP